MDCTCNFFMDIVNYRSLAITIFASFIWIMAFARNWWIRFGAKNGYSLANDNPFRRQKKLFFINEDQGVGVILGFWRIASLHFCVLEMVVSWSLCSIFWIGLNDVHCTAYFLRIAFTLTARTSTCAIQEGNWKDFRSFHIGHFCTAWSILHFLIFMVQVGGEFGSVVTVIVNYTVWSFKDTTSGIGF